MSITLLSLALVLLVSVHRRPGGCQLLQVGPGWDGEGGDTVSDLTGREGQTVSCPLFIPLAPGIHTHTVSSTVTIRVKLRPILRSRENRDQIPHLKRAVYI